MGEFFRELKHVVADVAASVVGRFKRIGHDFGSPGAHETVIVFVPGYTVVHNPVRRGIVDKLRAEGFTVAAFNPGSTANRDIQNIAHELFDFIEEVCRRTRSSTVAVVAHSMGGLIAKQYLQKFGGHRRIAKLITLGTPFGGTRVAYVGAHTRAARQMLPGSSFLSELSKDTRYLDRILSIRASRDHVIKPKTSPRLEGARNVEVSVAGHTTLRDSNEVITIIKKELT